MKRRWASVVAMTTLLGLGVGPLAWSTQSTAAASFGVISAKASTVSTPVVYSEQVDHVSPGEAFQLAGDGFTSQTQVKVWVVDGNNGLGVIGKSVPSLPATPPSDSYTLQNLSATNDSLVSKLPSSVPTGIYAVYTSNDGVNWSKPFVYNQSNPWYLEYQTAVPGQANMILGNNFNVSGSLTITLFSPTTHRKLKCDVTGSDANEVSFTVPVDTPPGTYEVWVGNGAGGDYGLVNNLSLTVAAISSPPTTVYNVVTGFGADPSGVQDSTSALQQAFDAAANNPDGGTVYLPAGTYTISSKLMLDAAKGRVVLLGAGMNKTVIQESSTASYSQPQWDLYGVSQSDSYGMLYMAPGNNPVDINQIGFDTNGNSIAAIEIDGRNNVAIDHAYFKADVMHAGSVPLFRGCYGVYAQNNKELTLSNSVYYANNAFFGENETDIRVLNNQMYLDYPQANSQPINCGIQIWGSKRVTIVHNNFDRDGSTYYYGKPISFGALKTSTLMYGAADTAFQEDTYVGYNTMHNGGSPWNNNGELVVGDTDSGIIPGAGPTLSVSSATSNTVSVANPTFNVLQASGTSVDDSQMNPDGGINHEQTNPIGAYVFITSGTGAGEVRKVVANTSTELTLNAPWDVVPDSTSKFIVQLAYEHNAYVNNTATQAQKYIGVFASGVFNVFNNNNVDGSGSFTPGGEGTGVALWSIVNVDNGNPGSAGQYPAFYNEVEGNTINDGSVQLDGPSFSGTVSHPDYPIMRDNVIADNQVTNPISGGSGTQTGTILESSSGTWGQDNLILNNSVSGSGTPGNTTIGSGYDRTIVQGSGPVSDSRTNTVIVH